MSRSIVSQAVLAWVVSCAVSAQGVAVSQSGATSVTFPLQAVSVAGYWGSNHVAAGEWHEGRSSTIVPADYLAWLRHLHANWVSISVALTYDDSLDSTVERRREHVSLSLDASFSDRAFRQLIREFRSHGIDVYLTLAFEAERAQNAVRPIHRWMLGDSGDDGPCCRFGILPENWPWWPDHPNHVGFVAEFWETYTREAVHFATLAEEEGVRIFSLGTETDRLFQTRSGGFFTTGFGAELRSMVHRVRAVYSGLLTYDAHYDVLVNPDFYGPGAKHLWNDLDLDVVGVSAWMPLVDAPSTTVTSVAQAEAGYERIFADYMTPLAEEPGPADCLS